MSTYNRKNQILNWYTDGIYLCTEICGIADEIEAECKRRNLSYSRVWTRELLVGKEYSSLDLSLMGHDICKIGIAESLEAFDKKLQKLHAPYCVPALKKKQLADWAVTTFNMFGDLEGRYSDAYSVWIQPSSDVQLARGSSLEEIEEGVETQWVKFR